MTIKYEIMSAVIAITHSLPTEVQAEALTDKILQIFEKHLDENLESTTAKHIKELVLYKK